MTLPGIVEFIHGTRQALLASAEGLTPDQANFRPGVERWSIGQLLRHVALTESGIGRRMEQLAEQARAQALPRRVDELVDLAVFERVRQEAAGKRFQAPERVAPGPELVELPAAMAELASARNRVLGVVPTLEAHDMKDVAFPHPFFGDFNCYQWLYFLGLHEGRHRNQIEAVKSIFA